MIIGIILYCTIGFLMGHLICVEFRLDYKRQYGITKLEMVDRIWVGYIHLAVVAIWPLIFIIVAIAYPFKYKALNAEIKQMLRGHMTIINYKFGHISESFKKTVDVD